MIRKDREVTDFNEIVEMLNDFDVIRVAMQGDDYPYVVPLSFGFEVIEGRIVIYIHGAKIGKKIELLTESDKVCVEADQFIRYEQDGPSITTRYKSIIGYGKATEVTDTEEKLHALNCMSAHCGYADYDSSVCKSFPATRCFKIEIEEITGKKNLRSNPFK